MLYVRFTPESVDSEGHNGTTVMLTALAGIAIYPTHDQRQVEIPVNEISDRLRTQLGADPEIEWWDLI